jgi:hypothetical protein
MEEVGDPPTLPTENLAFDPATYNHPTDALSYKEKTP